MRLIARHAHPGSNGSMDKLIGKGLSVMALIAQIGNLSCEKIRLIGLMRIMTDVTLASRHRWMNNLPTCKTVLVMTIVA
jgi:hypothetical protein